MPRTLSQAVRERLREQSRREQELAAIVLGADARLTAETSRRDALVAERDRVVASRRDDLAEALVAYLDGAGVGLERAALILDRPKAVLARLVRECRTASGRRGP